MGRSLSVVLGLVVVLGGCRDGGDQARPPPSTSSSTSPSTTLAALATTTTAPVPAQGMLRAELTEVHDFRGPPDKGFLVLTLSRGQAQICYEIMLRETDRATEVHLHQGSATVATLNPQIGTPGQAGEGERGGRGGHVGNRRCEAADVGLVDRLLADPSSFSADVHTAMAPAGAVRGTFVPQAGG